LAVAIILTGHLGRHQKEKPWPERPATKKDKRKYSLSAATAGRAEHSYMEVMVITRRARFKRGCLAGQKRARLSKVEREFILH
jgi:hypothetical protein